MEINCSKSGLADYSVYFVRQSYTYGYRNSHKYIILKALCQI